MQLPMNQIGRFMPYEVSKWLFHALRSIQMVEAARIPEGEGQIG